jgi:hypothetical protein
MNNCFTEVKRLIDDNLIDKDNYSYLVNLVKYLQKNKDSFQTKEQLFILLQKEINH